MWRRVFLVALVGAATIWPISARTQQAEEVRKVGILVPYPESDTEVQARVTTFRQELGKLGWAVGKNLQFEERWATDNLDRIRSHAAELVELDADVILTTGSRVIPIVQQQTRVIPIIFVGTTDPVGQGFVSNLARPGGNTTGFMQSELTGDRSLIIGKMFELLVEIAPKITRVAMMFNPANPATSFHSRSFQAVAAGLKVDAVTFPVRQPAEIERAIEEFARTAPGGMLFPSDLTILAQRKFVTGLLARHGVPAIFADDVIARDGGLISYGADRTEMFRQAAHYADRILRGEKAGDLPVQQPTRYNLVINLKTAAALGLAVPPSLLIRADEVVE